MVHHSTYLDMPPAWLGKRFLDGAERLKSANPPLYEHEYLGVPNGTTGSVFENLSLRTISDDEIAAAAAPPLAGVDFGYWPDAWAWNRMAYDPDAGRLLIFDELTLYKKSNRETFYAILARGVLPREVIYCDSAEPKSISDYRGWGLRARGAIKGPGSLAYSMRWLQGLSQIAIDPARCPDTAREFAAYEYSSDPGAPYPDRNDHHIAAVRYGTEPYRRRAAMDD